MYRIFSFSCSYLCYVCHYLVSTVSFEKEAYSVNEVTELVEIVLMLSEASSTDIAFTVSSRNGLATGKYCTYICINHLLKGQCVGMEAVQSW